MTELSQFASQRARAYYYRIVLAAAPLLVLYGVASQAEVATWIGVASAILGTGVAAANTSTKREPYRLDH